MVLEQLNTHMQKKKKKNLGGSVMAFTEVH